MNLISHIKEQPFVFATGLAALIHSTWSLGTMFSGEQPEAGLTIAFLGWIVPAFLIAFAMDVGQIATSAEIRGGNRSHAKYATFAVFAISTYFLQWLYMAHHMPALALAAGVRDEWRWLATLIRDAAVWIIPLFLPLSTLMYTFSSDHAQPLPADTAPVMPEIIPVQVSTPILEALPAPVAELAEQLPDDSSHTVTCAACGQWSKTYDNPDSAARGLAAHLSRHCTARFPVVAGNGNGHHHD